MKVKVSPVRVAILAFFLVLFVAGVVLGGKYLIEKIFPKAPVTTEVRPLTQPTTIPQIGQPSTTAPTVGQPTVEVIQPVGATTEAAPSVDSRPVLTIGEDQFGSYFIAQQITQDQSLPFQLKIVPFGFNADVGNPSEQDRGTLLANGQLDILLTTQASLSRMGNIGKIIFIIDQSNGADVIVVKAIASNGSPIVSFNDLRGKSICVADGNVNHFAILAALRVAGIDPSEVIWNKFASVPEAVDSFISGHCDVVGAWEPEASRAITNGAGYSLIDSSYWHNITDVAVVSNQALAEKSDLIYAFTAAWMKYSKMQSENLKLAGEQIARWTYPSLKEDGTIEYLPSNDWTFVYSGSEEADMHLWLDTIAQAGLVENIVSMQNIGYLKLQISAARDAWMRAGMIIDIMPYDLETLIYPDYINKLSSDASLINSGMFANANFQAIPEDLPDADISQLLGLNTIAKLPCETFTFLPNSGQLSETGKQEVRSCAAAARDMILSSQGQILITGSSAWPSGYTEKQIYDMANTRAMSIYQEFLRMGIPTNRMVTYVQLPPLSDRNSLNETILSKYRFVRIEIKVLGK